LGQVHREGIHPRSILHRSVNPRGKRATLYLATGAHPFDDAILGDRAPDAPARSPGVARAAARRRSPHGSARTRSARSGAGSPCDRGPPPAPAWRRGGPSGRRASSRWIGAASAAGAS
jgi:hypothetical protein